MSYEKTIPDFLRSARSECRMSQPQVAEAIGVSTATIINWESGKAMPPFDKVNALADLYHVSLDRLAGRAS